MTAAEDRGVQVEARTIDVATAEGNLSAAEDAVQRAAQEHRRAAIARDKAKDVLIQARLKQSTCSVCGAAPYRPCYAVPSPGMVHTARTIAARREAD